MQAFAHVVSAREGMATCALACRDGGGTFWLRTRMFRDTVVQCKRDLPLGAAIQVTRYFQATIRHLMHLLRENNSRLTCM